MNPYPYVVVPNGFYGWRVLSPTGKYSVAFDTARQAEEFALYLKRKDERKHNVQNKKTG